MLLDTCNSQYWFLLLLFLKEVEDWKFGLYLFSWFKLGPNLGSLRSAAGVAVTFAFLCYCLPSSQTQIF